MQKTDMMLRNPVQYLGGQSEDVLSIGQFGGVLARAGVGKTALMERLFNITYYRNNGVIPFYYEIKEMDIWVLDFCKNFFLSFIYQYIAFKSRKPEYLTLRIKSNFETAVEIAKKEGLDYLCEMIEDAALAVAHVAPRHGELAGNPALVPSWEA